MAGKRKYAGKGKSMKGRKKMKIPSRLKGYVRTGGYFGTAAPGAELKFLDHAIDDAVVASAGAILVATGGSAGTLNAISQGTGQTQRDGRKCTVKQINWKYELTLPASATSGDVVRVMLVLDKQCNGATAAVTDILASADYQAFNNLANSGRFRTLMDRTYAINATAGIAGTIVTEVIQDSFYHKCNIPLEFSSTNGVITEVRSNNITGLVISQSGVAGMVGNLRLRFVG